MPTLNREYEINRLYSRRSDIPARYGEQSQGGISTPVDCQYIFLFIGESGAPFGYEDHWDDQGIFHYVWEGQVGDCAGIVKLTDLRMQLGQPVSSKSLIVSCGVGMFRLQKDEIYVNLKVPPNRYNTASRMFPAAEIVLNDKSQPSRRSTFKPSLAQC